MAPDIEQQRRQAHAMLDMLPARKLNAVRNLLEVMVEPLERSLAPRRFPAPAGEAEAGARVPFPWPKLRVG